MGTRSDEALAAYERRWAKPLLWLSVLYLAVVFVELLPDVHVGTPLLIMDGVLWAVFAGDYFYRVLFLAPRPLRYMAEPLCILDAVVVLSYPVLLFFQFAELGFARVARVFVQSTRALRVGAQGGKAAHHASSLLDRRNTRVIVPGAALLVFLCGLLLWRYEVTGGSDSIHTWYDALLWSLSTVATVGYGDVYPETMAGKVAGVVLILVGVALFGWLTAGLASLFVEQDERNAAGGERDVHAKLDAIAEQLEKLDERIEQLLAERSEETGVR